MSGSPRVNRSAPQLVVPWTATTAVVTGSAWLRRTSGVLNRTARPTAVSRFSGTLPTAGTKSGSPSRPHVHPGGTAASFNAVYIGLRLYGALSVAKRTSNRPRKWTTGSLIEATVKLATTVAPLSTSMVVSSRAPLCRVECTMTLDGAGESVRDVCEKTSPAALGEAGSVTDAVPVGPEQELGRVDRAERRDEEPAARRAPGE